MICLPITSILCLFSFNSGKKSGFKLGQHVGFKDGYCEGKMEVYKKEPKKKATNKKPDNFEWIG